MYKSNKLISYPQIVLNNRFNSVQNWMIRTDRAVQQWQAKGSIWDNPTS